MALLRCVPFVCTGSLQEQSSEVPVISNDLLAGNHPHILLDHMLLDQPCQQSCCCLLS